MGRQQTVYSSGSCSLPMTVLLPFEQLPGRYVGDSAILLSRAVPGATSVHWAFPEETRTE